MERGRDGFNRYYAGLFHDRWPSLSTFLVAPGLHGELSEGLQRPYHLNPASIAVAELLPITHANEIVDLCAAPGGKSLVLVLRSCGLLPSRAGAAEDGAEPRRGVRIALNEKSNRRRRRLITVVDGHLPPSIRERVRIYGHDAARWGIHRPETADSVLVDAPCSSEAHVLSDEEELAKWSASRIKRNAVVQHALIASAIDTVRPGGYVLYATCALTPEENDAVVAWALQRRADRIQPVADCGFHDGGNAEGEPLSLRSTEILGAAERTDFGIHILPDRTNGAGPLYGALLRRGETADRS